MEEENGYSGVSGALNWSYMSLSFWCSLDAFSVASSLMVMNYSSSSDSGVDSVIIGVEWTKVFWGFNELLKDSELSAFWFVTTKTVKISSLARFLRYDSIGLLI